mmetsp:Transcript_59044/g.156725  ORF Transcript_59044/g.156725 Transcript_59044/m.156725 type:complete len:210 (-) Transcript_59044:286-915(-)
MMVGVRVHRRHPEESLDMVLNSLALEFVSTLDNELLEYFVNDDDDGDALVSLIDDEVGRALPYTDEFRDEANNILVWKFSMGDLYIKETWTLEPAQVIKTRKTTRGKYKITEQYDDVGKLASRVLKINGAEAGINRPDKDSEHFDVVGYLSRGHKKLGPASKALRWLALILFLAIMAVTIFGGLTVIVASMVYGPACKYPGVGAGDAGE